MLTGLLRFSEIGAGVGLGPNSVKAFDMLGLGDTYEKVADMSDGSNPLWFQFLDHSDGSPIQEVQNLMIFCLYIHSSNLGAQQGSLLFRPSVNFLACGKEIKLLMALSARGCWTR
jgi:hypothetical protein